MHPRLTVVSVLIALALGFSLPSAQAQSAPANGLPITITITNVNAHTGFFMVALHQGSFDNAAVARVRVPVETTTFVMRAPGPGRYAVRLFHDVNSDGELGTGFLGIPNEPYGASNDAPSRMGPPRYRDAEFEVTTEGATQTITLR